MKWSDTMNEKELISPIDTVSRSGMYFHNEEKDKIYKKKNKKIDKSESKSFDSLFQQELMKRGN